MTLPLDVSRCEGTGCDLAPTCRRTERPEIDTWVYWVSVQYVDGQCPNYLPASEVE